MKVQRDPVYPQGKKLPTPRLRGVRLRLRKVLPIEGLESSRVNNRVNGTRLTGIKQRRTTADTFPFSTKRSSMKTRFPGLMMVLLVVFSLTPMPALLHTNQSKRKMR